jgi:hypothetical protein
MVKVLEANEREYAEQASDEWFLTPCFLLRMGGLPFESLNSLRFEKTKAIVEQILELEQWFDNESDGLCEMIFSAVKRAEDQALKRRLIELKRNVFNRRLISREDVESLKTLFPASDYSAIVEWRERVASLAHLMEEGEIGFQQELSEKRNLLKTLLTDEDFQKGIVLSSEALFTALEQYLQTPVQKMKRPHFKAESSLIAYLSRTAAKTSPFSTFTPTAMGFWTKTGEALEFSQEPARRKSFVRFNQGLRVRIEKSLSCHPSIKGYLYPQVSKSWRLRGNILSLFKSGSVALFGSGDPETFIKLPMNAALKELLRLIEEGQGRLSYTELINRMVERIGGSREAGEVEKFLDRLIQLDVIENNFQIPEQATDFLPAMAEKLRAIPGPFALETLSLINSISQEIVRYPLLNARERLDSLRILGVAIRRLFAILNLRLEDHAIIIYEDMAAYPRQLELSLSAWSDALSDLRLVQRLNRISDYTVSQIMTLAAYFNRRQGNEQVEDDLLAFYEDYRQAISPASGSKDSSPWDKLIHLNPLNLEEVSEFQEVQQEYRVLLAEQLESSEDIVHLDREKLESILDRIPDFAHEMSSQAYFCQPIISPAGNKLVMNAPYEGLGKYFSRFCFLFDKAGEDVNPLVDTIRQTQARLRRSDQIYAELESVLGSNVNLHPPVTDFEISYPGVIGSRPPEKQIELSGISLRRDPQTGLLKLWSHGLQKEVIPLHLGLTHVWFLPPLQQFLYCLFSPVGTMNAMPGLEVGITKHENNSAFRRYPRVCVGDVVLWRAEWRIPAADLPAKQKQESEFGYFLRVNRWRKQLSLPDEGFVIANSFFDLLERYSEASKQAQVASSSPAQDKESGQGKDNSPVRMRDTSRKPQYIDFNNYFLLSIFSKMTSMVNRSLIFQEMLPSSKDLVLQNETGHYVTELLIELNYRCGQQNENLA